MNLDYVAGFFDGDGAVSLNITDVPADRQRRKVNIVHRICFAQATRNATILEEIQKFLGMGRITHRKYGEIADLHIAKREDVRKFVELMRDRVVVKREPLLLLANALAILGDKNRSYSWQQIEQILKIREKVMLHASPHRSRMPLERFERTKHVIETNGIHAYYRDRERFAAKLRTYQHVNSLSIAECSRRLGIRASTLRSYLRGEHIPLRKQMEKIMQVLNRLGQSSKMSATDHTREFPRTGPYSL